MMKRLLLISLILMSSITARCQMILGKLGTETLVEDALKGGFALVCTQYQLKENSSGNLYGRGGRNFFGESYSLGYMFSQGCILSEEALCPWENDSNFDKYRKNEKYSPVLMDSIYLKSANINASQERLFIRSVSQLPNTDLRCVSLEIAANAGLPINQELGKMSGWFVWCMIPKGNTLGKESLFSFTSLYRTIEINDTTSISIETPKIGDTLLGGLFVVPQIDSIGKITLNTKGILQRSDNDKWLLRVYNNDWNVQQASEKDEVVGTTEPNQEEGELNLVTTGKKKKKSKTRK